MRSKGGQGLTDDEWATGDVFYMGRTNGSNLYSVDAGTGHAFIKVDNTSVVPYDQKRDSVSPTSLPPRSE